MQVEISPETEERLQALVDRGAYPTLQAALDGVVAEVTQQEAEYEAELTRKLDKARDGIAGGKGVLLTREFVGQFLAEMHAEYDARRGS